MPELPEVETARRNLHRWLVGRRLLGADIMDKRILGTQSARAFRAAIKDRWVSGTNRHGKHALVELDDRLWWIHLGMSGKLRRRETSQEIPHTRIRVYFEGGVVHFSAPRLLARTMAGTATKIRAETGIDKLGPDALTITDGPALMALFRPTKTAIKVALMNQKRLAGLGNIQAAEALFRARVHPDTPLEKLGPTRWARIAGGIADTLGHTLEATEADDVEYMSDGAHVANPFLVYGRQDEPCTVCGSAIKRTVQSGRATFFCPKCQRR